MQAVSAERVPRIYMGRIIAPSGAETGSGKYVMRLGNSGDGIRSQVEEIATKLRKYALKPENSLYAEDKGALQRFSEEILRNTKKGDVEGIIERVIDSRPFLGEESELKFPRLYTTSYDFRFDSGFIAPDIVPTVGLILSQERRKVHDPVTRSQFFTISQVMESYLLAAAVLRHAGLQAYPATAVISLNEMEEDHKPILALIDTSNSQALTTFDILRKHPLMGAVDVISDEALWGVGHVMRAENRIKHLIAEISLLGMEGGELDPTELKLRLAGIAESLFECHSLWPGCHFIKEVLAFLGTEIYRSSVELATHLIRSDWVGFAQSNPDLASNPSLLEQHVQESAAADALGIEQATRYALTELIETEGATGTGKKYLN